jgi:hypothetical protein
MSAKSNMSAGEWMQSTIISLVIACGGIVFLLAYCVPEYRRMESLRESPTTQATISSVYKPKGNGQFAAYSYVVNGMKYTGRSEFTGSTGDRVGAVHYLASDPGVSSMEPEMTGGRLKSALEILIILILGVFGLSVFCWTQSRRKSREGG